MSYKIQWKEKGSTFRSKKVWGSKSAAEKVANHMRQSDDDLPLKQRDKTLKTWRVVKAKTTKKIVSKPKRSVIKQPRTRSLTQELYGF